MREEIFEPMIILENVHRSSLPGLASLGLETECYCLQKFFQPSVLGTALFLLLGSGLWWWWIDSELSPLLLPLRISASLQQPYEKAQAAILQYNPAKQGSMHHRIGCSLPSDMVRCWSDVSYPGTKCVLNIQTLHLLAMGEWPDCSQLHGRYMTSGMWENKESNGVSCHAGQLPNVYRDETGTQYMFTEGGNQVVVGEDKKGRVYFIDQNGNFYYDTGDPNLGFYMVFLNHRDQHKNHLTIYIWFPLLTTGAVSDHCLSP